MNFFAHQASARRQSRRLVVLFVLAVAAIVLLVNLGVMLVFGIRPTIEGPQAAGPGIFIAISVIVTGIIGCASLYRISTLRSGGAAVAAQLGAVLVPSDSTDFTYRRLRNIVEEVAIASGVPVPDIFVLEDEAGINAFAAGYAPADAAITVTRGALDTLTRDELQGVIAHEFSHVLNGDMRLNIRLLGLVFGLLVVALIGRRILAGAGRSRSRDSLGAVLLLGLALFAAGYAGVFFGRLIQASISRQREYLADASAVQFTRNPGGIAGALKKIGALAQGSRLDTPGRDEVAHMLFGEGGGRRAWFATHPPLPARIRRLDPGFRDSELEVLARAWARPVRVGEAAVAGASIAGFAPAASAADSPRPGSGEVPVPGAQVRITPRGVVHQVARPDLEDHLAARALREGIPASLRNAAHQAETAIPLVFALLLDTDAGVRERQLADVEDRYDTGTRTLVARLGEAVKALHPMHRLPLAALAFPALRRRPRGELTRLMVALHELALADGRVSLAEWCLARLLRAQVIEALEPSGSVDRSLRLPAVRSEVVDLFSILARHGHADADVARRAFQLGLAETLPGEAAAYTPPPDFAAALERALSRLDQLQPAAKELLIAGMVRAIAADGAVSVTEAELLRTVCAVLHCPLPPILEEFHPPA